MIEKAGPAIKRSYDILKSKLAQGAWKSGDRLPSSKIFARSLDVSPTTLLKAIALLKSEGLVYGKTREPLRAGSEKSANISIPEKKAVAAWHLKRIALGKDILSGAYALAGRLPSCKELQNRYGCSHTTLKKILHALAADHVLELRGKSWVLPAYAPRHSSERIVFITMKGALLRSALNKEKDLVLEILESECIRRGLKLETIALDFYNSVEIHEAILGDRIKMPALGFVLDVWWFTTEEMRASYVILLGRLIACKSSIAIIDELGTFTLPLPFSANPLVQVFAAESRNAGGRLARYLINLGHRSVAFISMAHIFSWSRERLQGIQEHFSHAGLPDAAFPVVIDTMDVAYLYILAMSGFPDPVIRKVISTNNTKSQAKDYFEAYVRFKRTWSPRQFSEKDVADYQRNFKMLAMLLDTKPSKDFFVEIYDGFIRTAERRLVTMSLTPLFEQALKNKVVTAWICASDHVAFSALSFLHERKISVPEGISIAGFDNMPHQALDHQLTTFDFNASGLVHQMINYIVRPPKPRGVYHHSVIEVEGMVVERGTTGKPHFSP